MTEIDYTKWEYPESDLEVLEEFNGHVIDIDTKRNTFWIRCEDTGDEISDIEIPSHTLLLEERPYLAEGAYCRIRYYKDPDYENETIEEFIFNKRVWSQEEIDEATRKAKELSKALNWIRMK